MFKNKIFLKLFLKIFFVNFFKFSLKNIVQYKDTSKSFLFVSIIINHHLSTQLRLSNKVMYYVIKVMFYVIRVY